MTVSNLLFQNFKEGFPPHRFLQAERNFRGWVFLQISKFNAENTFLNGFGLEGNNPKLFEFFEYISKIWTKIYDFCILNIKKTTQGFYDFPVTRNIQVIDKKNIELPLNKRCHVLSELPAPIEKAPSSLPLTSSHSFLAESPSLISKKQEGFVSPPKASQNQKVSLPPQQAVPESLLSSSSQDKKIGCYRKTLDILLGGVIIPIVLVMWASWGHKEVSPYIENNEVCRYGFSFPNMNRTLPVNDTFFHNKEDPFDKMGSLATSPKNLTYNEQLMLGKWNTFSITPDNFTSFSEAVNATTTLSPLSSSSKAIEATTIVDDGEDQEDDFLSIASSNNSLANRNITHVQEYEAPNIASDEKTLGITQDFKGDFLNTISTLSKCLIAMFPIFFSQVIPLKNPINLSYKRLDIPSISMRV